MLGPGAEKEGLGRPPKSEPGAKPFFRLALQDIF
jgi:hypothetical protein